MYETAALADITFLTVNKHAGFGVATPFATNRAIVYRIYCGGVPSGFNSGTAQERISDFMVYLDPNDPDAGVEVPTSGLWLPPTSGPNFYLEGPLIGDVTGNALDDEPAFQAVEVGRVFVKYFQELRLVMTCQALDGQPTQVTYPLGTIALQKRKVSATEYVVEYQPVQPPPVED